MVGLYEAGHGAMFMMMLAVVSLIQSPVGFRALGRACGCGVTGSLAFAVLNRTAGEGGNGTGVDADAGAASHCPLVKLLVAIGGADGWDQG